MQSSGSKARNRLRPTFSAARVSQTSESTSSVVYELKCQREHARVNKQYRHAQVLENELNLLKHVHEDRRLQELAEKHAGELSACDAEYCEAYQRLAGAWTAKIRDLQQQLQVAEQQLLIRQEDETAALMVAQATVPARPKFSPALLNMRHIERSLALQKAFDKADKVRQQADQLEEMELQQIEYDRAAKMEIEQTHLATRHSKEREAAAKKSSSALLSAQQRQDIEAEQLTRRFQAIKLALTRAHAAQRLNLQQSLVKSLGIKKPTKLLELPSFNSSLADTRGLVPQQPQRVQCFDSTAACRAAATPGSGGPHNRSRCTSPLACSPSEHERAAESIAAAEHARCRSPALVPSRTAAGSPVNSINSIKSSKSRGILCNPERTMHYDPYEHTAAAVAGRLGAMHSWNPSPVIAPKRRVAAADAAAAAAGLGITSMPPLRPASRKAAVSQTPAATYKKPMTAAGDGHRQLSWAGYPVTGRVTPDAAGLAADCRIPAGNSYDPSSAATGLPDVRGSARQLSVTQAAAPAVVDLACAATAGGMPRHNAMALQEAGLQSTGCRHPAGSAAGCTEVDSSGAIRPPSRQYSRSAAETASSVVASQLSRPVGSVSSGRRGSEDWVHRASDTVENALPPSTSTIKSVAQYKPSAHSDDTEQQESLEALRQPLNQEHAANHSEAGVQESQGYVQDMGYDACNLPSTAASTITAGMPDKQPGSLQASCSNAAVTEAADCLSSDDLTPQKQQAEDAATQLLLQQQNHSKQFGNDNAVMHIASDVDAKLEGFHNVLEELQRTRAPAAAADNLLKASEQELSVLQLTQPLPQQTDEAESYHTTGCMGEEPGPTATVDDSIEKQQYSTSEQTALVDPATDSNEAGGPSSQTEMQPFPSSYTGSPMDRQEQHMAVHHVAVVDAPDARLNTETEAAMLLQSLATTTADVDGVASGLGLDEGAEGRAAAQEQNLLIETRDLCDEIEQVALEEQYQGTAHSSRQSEHSAVADQQRLEAEPYDLPVMEHAAVVS